MGCSRSKVGLAGETFGPATNIHVRGSSDLQGSPSELLSKSLPYESVKSRASSSPSRPSPSANGALPGAEGFPYVLLERPGDAFSLQVRMTLKLKGVHYETMMVPAKSKCEPWFLKVSPDAAVPTLCCRDGRNGELQPAWEHPCDPAGTIDHLQREHPKPDLLPPQFKHYIGDLYHLAVKELPACYARVLWRGNPIEQRRWRARLTKCLQKLEDRMAKSGGEGPYFFGDTVSKLDVLLCPFLYRLPLLERFRCFHVPDSMPHMHRYIAGMDCWPFHAPMEREVDVGYPREALASAYARMIKKRPPTAVWDLCHRAAEAYLAAIVQACDPDVSGSAAIAAVQELVEPEPGSPLALAAAERGDKPAISDSADVRGAVLGYTCKLRQLFRFTDAVMTSVLEPRLREPFPEAWRDVLQAQEECMGKLADVEALCGESEGADSMGSAKLGQLLTAARLLQHDMCAVMVQAEEAALPGIDGISSEVHRDVFSEVLGTLWPQQVAVVAAGVQIMSVCAAEALLGLYVEHARRARDDAGAARFPQWWHEELLPAIVEAVQLKRRRLLQHRLGVRLVT